MIVGILWILVGIVVMLVGASRPDIDKMPALQPFRALSRESHAVLTAVDEASWMDLSLDKA